MAVDFLVKYPEWQQNFLAEIDARPHATAKGDTFVHKVLQIYYNLSEEDAIDATDCAGAGDKGVDAVYVFPTEDDDSPHAYVVQGKYGTAGTSLDIYSESQKFFSALKTSIGGTSVTPAVDKVAGVLKHGGLVRYVIATVESLDQPQKNNLSNIKKIANFDFGDKLVVEAISLENVYNVYTALNPVETDTSVKVNLPCQIVRVSDDAYVGVSSLADMYGMLSSYANHGDGTIDSIYDHNIRKYLKRRTGSVNDGIYKTLEKEASRFIAYNNGITIICRAAQQTMAGLELDTPFIVNGCQTTRTLYDFMNTKFAGIDVQHDPNNKMQAYKEAFMAIKVLVVTDTEDDSYASSITRFSNKQNAIRGKDFIALEDMYKKLKAELLTSGYFLETQAGEYDVLPKHKKMQYPKDTNVINSFEATLLYAAGVLGKAHDSFGRSGDFMPGGREFDATVKDLEANDLFVPWMIALQAREKLGYTTLAQRNPQQGTEHRGQTRYLFLYLFFYLIREEITKGATKHEMYHMLKAIKEDYDLHPGPLHPFYQLLSFADKSVATFMKLAQKQGWYTDRNAFLKSKESTLEERIILATAAVTMDMAPIAEQIKAIMSGMAS